jgi:hypothetical protein
VRLEERDQAGELGEHEGLVAFVEDFHQRRQQSLDLRAGLFRLLRVDEAGVAGELAQAQQGFEDVHLGTRDALVGDAL